MRIETLFANKPDNKIGLISAGILWEQLVMRYDAIELTQTNLNYIHDPDFRLIVERGLSDILKREVKAMEEKMIHYNVQLPSRPPIASTYSQTAPFEDRYIYRNLFGGIQSYLAAHIRAINGCVFNDDLRDMYIGFLKEEVDLLNEFAKYGKIKGWLYPSPQYESH